MCEHVMTSGKNKGENCGKTTENFFIGMEKFAIPYCSTHKTKYENLWKPLLEDQKEKYKRKQEEERQPQGDGEAERSLRCHVGRQQPLG